METTSRLSESSITHILQEEQFSLDQPPTKPLVDKSVALLMLASSNTSFKNTPKMINNCTWTLQILQCSVKIYM